MPTCTTPNDDDDVVQNKVHLFSSGIVNLHLLACSRNCLALVQNSSGEIYLALSTQQKDGDLCEENSIFPFFSIKLLHKIKYIGSLYT